MTVLHKNKLQVRSYELNSSGVVNHAVYLQWFQEVAFDASAALGYDMKAYADLNAAWVMRGIDVEFLQPAHYQENIEVTTWVSDFRRVRSHREYEARRASDGALLTRAHADWVFIDSTTFALRRVPAEAVALFAPDGRPAVEPMQWPDPAAGQALGHFEEARRVQKHELDNWMHHVNNSVYVNWIEQQAGDAWRAWGLASGSLNLQRHLIEYRQAALENETLQLVSDAARLDRRIIWNHRILRGDAVLIEARSIGEITL